MSIGVKNILGNVSLRRKQKIPYDLFYIFSLFQYYLDNDDSENFINLMKY